MLNSWFFILFFMLLSSAACQYSARNTLVHGPDYCSTQPEKHEYLVRKPHCLFLCFFVPRYFFCPEFENLRIFLYSDFYPSFLSRDFFCPELEN